MFVTNRFWISAFVVFVLLGTQSPVIAQSDVAVPDADAEPVAPPIPKTKANTNESSSSKASGDSAYIRIRESDEGDPLALQTAIVRYVGKPGTKYDGAIVDLVGVVHIGSEEYYDRLDHWLALYDKVLFELVAPDGQTRITPEKLQNRRSLLSSMQGGMKDMLGLEYQLEKINYLAANFRHADMSPEEFAADFERRGDSVLKMMARMMGAGLATQAQGGDMGMLVALFSDDRSKQMKRTMAKQLVQADAVTAAMDDANGENTLIKGRNLKAFEILTDELSRGSDQIAVFYGAGHLADMAERLEADFEMKPISTVWLDAWDLTTN